MDERITHLTTLTASPAAAGHQDLVARGCGVLNYAALIASDVGMPDLATDLCWRQHLIFTDAENLAGDIAAMSLMPLINISRLLTRQGDGREAYELLQDLFGAAQARTTTEIDGHIVDLAALTRTEADHRKICQELWTSLLVDGARALAREGRWTDAAQAMTEHRGIGNRMLDGRQISIMALMERGLDAEARDTIDTSATTEPWEHTVAILLRAHCQPEPGALPAETLDHIAQAVTAQIGYAEPSTAVFHTRLGLGTLDLPARPGSDLSPLQAAIIQTAALDAYAAREVRHHPVASALLTDEQHRNLEAVVQTAGLGAGALPPHHMQTLAETVDQADEHLRQLL
ncbi:hypothetical protein [Myceligenerans halotolerans]